MKTFGLLAFASILLVTAILCLFFPGRIQVYAIRSVARKLPPGIRLARGYMEIVGRFVQSTQYLVCLRLIGLVGLAMFAFAAWMLLKHLRGEF